MVELERIQKYLARAGICSRRRCEQLMLEGHVAVNGIVVKQLGAKVNPKVDKVTVDGRRVVLPAKLVYVALNKPAGFITTVVEERGRPTVLDLIWNPENVFPSNSEERQKAEGLSEYRLFPVGRLDRDTEGLLILTNDGELANRLTHPRYALEKEYVVQVEGKPSAEALSRLRGGVEIDGEVTAPAKIRLVREADGSSWLSMTIHEGRKRQVRRMVEAVGYPALHLMRIRVGPLNLGKLPVGRYRFLGDQELAALRRAAGLAEAVPVAMPDRTAPSGPPRNMLTERTRPRKSAYTFKNRRRRT